jgi:hypothetical protein
MTDLLTRISGQFSKSLVFGALLPSTLFVALALVTIVPVLPTNSWLLLHLTALGPEWNLIAITFFTLVLSGILYSLNTSIIRLFEGYPWRASLYGATRTRCHAARMKQATVRWAGISTLLTALEARNRQRPDLEQYWKTLGLRLNQELPDSEDLILPTRLGNTIRSFEYYPDLRYGMDAVTLWPRLIGVIDQDYAAAIEEAKSSFDFVLNCSLLSVALAIGLLLAGLMSCLPFTSFDLFIPWLLKILFFAASAQAAYTISIQRAAAWGDLVKSAFDLYRWPLLKRLGYDELPSTVDQERSLWDAISQRMIFGELSWVVPPLYRRTLGQARATEPRGLALQSVRTVSRLPDGGARVTIQVSNHQEVPARDVLVTDIIPEGYDYVGNAMVEMAEAEGVTVTGTDPYEFLIGDVEAGEMRRLTYYIAARSQGS